jgi:hypothetical protein
MTDELKVSTYQATIKAKSVWGAIRGLETFSQLTFFTNDNLATIFLFENQKFNLSKFLFSYSFRYKSWF